MTNVTPACIGDSCNEMLSIFCIGMMYISKVLNLNEAKKDFCSQCEIDVREGTE